MQVDIIHRSLHRREGGAILPVRQQAVGRGILRKIMKEIFEEYGGIVAVCAIGVAVVSGMLKILEMVS